MNMHIFSEVHVYRMADACTLPMNSPISSTAQIVFYRSVGHLLDRSTRLCLQPDETP